MKYGYTVGDICDAPMDKIMYVGYETVQKDGRLNALSQSIRVRQTIYLHPQYTFQTQMQTGEASLINKRTFHLSDAPKCAL